MLFWRNKKVMTKELCDKENEVHAEVQNYKKATNKAILETKKTTDQFNRLMKKNHITLRIYIATGGHK